MIGILVVTYNQCETTINFIKNYQELFYSDSKLRLLILDNNSNDKTFERIKSKYPLIDIRQLNDNYGCVTGRNIGIVGLINMGCDYIYISDNDIEFEDKDFFKKMLEFMKSNPEIDGCCPIVRWKDDRTIQTLGARIRGGIGKHIYGMTENNRVDILPGCAQLIRAETFKRFGLYDNDLSPISIEDYEWGIRNRGKVLLRSFPEVEVFHTHNRSKKPSPEKIECVIIGRTVFLRNFFSILQLIRTIITSIHYVRDYGIVFTFRNHIQGMKKKLNKLNYDYYIFESNGLAQYFQDNEQCG